MTIHLSKDLEQIVQDAVHAGLYAREDDVIRDALIRLKQTMARDTEMAHQNGADLIGGINGEPGSLTSKAKTENELLRQMLADGLITRLPNPAADWDDEDDEPVVIEGEPLSETIIRERR